jgi:Spy/CpxP family protein refolding chaperone
MQALRKAQMEKRQGERAQRQAQMQQTRAQTEALINSPTINATALNTLADRQAAIAKQQFVERIQAQHAMAQILTPEQKATLKQMREERQAKFKNKAKGEHKGQTAQ